MDCDVSGVVNAGEGAVEGEVDVAEEGVLGGVEGDGYGSGVTGSDFDMGADEHEQADAGGM